MLRVFGKGDTINHNEFGNNRTNSNFLQDFITSEKENYLDLTQSIKEVIDNQSLTLEVLGKIKDVDASEKGVLKNSFIQEFKMKPSDIVRINILNRNKTYVRLPPGIAIFNGNIHIHKPDVTLGSVQLENIFEAKRNSGGCVEIKYDQQLDTFKCSIETTPEEYGAPIERKEYPAKTWLKNTGGYSHSAKLIEALYSEVDFSNFFIKKIGDDITKIQIEKLVEINQAGEYFWVMTLDGRIELVRNYNEEEQLLLNRFNYNGINASGINNNHEIYERKSFLVDTIYEILNGDEYLVKSSIIDLIYEILNGDDYLVRSLIESLVENSLNIRENKIKNYISKLVNEINNTKFGGSSINVPIDINNIFE